jgi:aspartate carbamoyltransferase regulatory subunit
MPKGLRCQNPTCGKLIEPRSRAIVKKFTVGAATYHAHYCSQECADAVAKRATRHD